jgi:thiosulfate/3-mercaptopyruvate sulfurtransferase
MVRSDEEYFGERVRARRGGAIPGAMHRDWRQAIAEDGAFKEAAQLRAEFEQMGLRTDCEIIPYCQGGYRSAHAYYALRLAGYPQVRNYLGSWGEWGNREDLPIDTPTRRRFRS